MLKNVVVFLNITGENTSWNQGKGQNYKNMAAHFETTVTVKMSLILKATIQKIFKTYEFQIEK